MNIRLSLKVLLATLSLPALATSGLTPGLGEAGGSTHVLPGGKTRAQVAQELSDWRRNPVSSDGWKEVSGEAGWVYVGIDRTAGNLSATADSASSQIAGSGAGLARSGHLSSTAHRGHR